MYKKALITVIAAVVLIAAVLICVIPRFHSVDVTLQTTKFNKQGESLGTYDIHIHGNRLDYLSGKDELEVTISTFDNLMNGHVAREKIRTLPGSGIGFVYYFVSNAATRDSVSFEIAFSPDMERWVFCNVSNKVYYLGSVDGKQNTQELVEYFHSFIPRNWLGE